MGAVVVVVDAVVGDGEGEVVVFRLGIGRVSES